MVYPRVCGGTSPVWTVGVNDVGLSPRVRGNRWEMPRTLSMSGSIPACAGEPNCFFTFLVFARVYPRVCGGTDESPEEWCYDVGLSPRVRGNRQCDAHPGSLHGSIPACAGEPNWVGSSLCSTRVYLRVCGGTKGGFDNMCTHQGLSPRVRGKPELTVIVLLTVGVYPRVCGGTQLYLLDSEPEPGLSPRVRGNQR